MKEVTPAASLRFFSEIAQESPDDVLEPARPYLAVLSPLINDPVGLAVQRAIDLFAQFSLSRDLEELNAAISLFSQNANASEADDPDRATILANLGSALREKFARIGQGAGSQQRASSIPSR